MLPLLLLTLFTRVLLAIKITGAGGGSYNTSSPQPFRYEIDDFSQPSPAWDLFVQALSTLQSRNQSDPMSYFQIAGIHGYPRIPWDGVPGTGNYPGYCSHSDQLFLSWHRPYLALYEQAIWEAAQVIASSYPDESRSLYQTAAWVLRIPYWDTIANPSMPWVTTVPALQINTPTGAATVPNPLLNYTFQSDAVGNGFPSTDPFANFPWTVRHFNSQSSDQSAATADLQSNAANLLATAYRIFTTVPDYLSVSTTAPLPNGTSNTGNNIENIHNSIHDSVGGNGHMIEPTLAAFDPIFWLHHANVDRQFALWQVLNPNSYVMSAVNNYGSYYELPGTFESGASSLAPFHDTDDSSTMWTSDGVRSISIFRYSYPELPYWRMNASALQDNVRDQINRLYNPAPPAQRQRSIPPKSHRAMSVAQAFSDISFEDAKFMGVNNARRQWFAKITIQRYAYNTTFTILAFMGQPPGDVSQWSWARNLVGTHGQFIATDVSRIFPQGVPTGELQGEISFTHTLVAGVERGILPNLDPDNVVPLLQQGLQWRARTADGCEIDITALAGLSIFIGSRTLTPTTSPNKFPVYGQVEWHPEVTQDASPGLQRGYRLP